MSPAVSQRLQRTAPLFSALGDPTRLDLVARLSGHGPQSISALAEDATISRQAVTKHLRVLETVGLAASRRRGRERIFALRPEGLAAVHRYLDEISRQWDEAIGRLRAHVGDVLERAPSEE